MKRLLKPITAVIVLLTLSISASYATEDTPKEYKKTKIIPKLSVIFGERFIGEAGLYRINYTFRDSSQTIRRRSHLIFRRNPFLYYKMHGLYASVEFFDYQNKTFYGPKIGYEVTTQTPTFGAAIGIEAKYYTNFNDSDNFVLAPKIGIPLQFMNFFYSYNWGSNDDFKDISGVHQFQLSFNIDFNTMKDIKTFFRKKKTVPPKPESKNPKRALPATQ